MLRANAYRLGERCLKVWASDRLLRGFSMLGLGDVFVRLSRVLTAIALARWLDAAELGIAATALTTFELIRVLANNGLGQMVVRAAPETLEATCNTVHRLFWLICTGMAVLQLIAGALLASMAGKPELLAMTAILGLVYLTMPPGMVQSWRLARDQRMGTVATIWSTQVTLDCLLAALFAVLGFGAWSVVLPKLLTAPIWLIGVRHACAWRPNRDAGRLPMTAMWTYSGPILGSELLGAIRVNADKLLVASILGLEALGIYYFAFSAGYGLSVGLTNALTAASFPHLAAKLSPKELIETFDSAMRRLALPICALVTLQSLAIFVYVPLCFGAKWIPVTPVVAVLCMSAVTKPCSDLAAQLLRAAGFTMLELKASFVFTVVLLTLFAAALTYGLFTGVVVIAIVSVSLQALFAAWARARVASRCIQTSTTTVAANGA